MTKKKHTSQKLSHLFRLAFQSPELLQEDEITRGGETKLVASPLLVALRTKEVVPFWEDECPETLREEWGEGWEDIHQKLQEMSEFENSGDVDRFDWSSHNLSRVRETAKKKIGTLSWTGR